MAAGIHGDAALSSARPSARLAVTATSPRADTLPTRALLACGLVAGPLYILLGVLQMLLGPGFDLRRHDLSLR